MSFELAKILERNIPRRNKRSSSLWASASADPKLVADAARTQTGTRRNPESTHQALATSRGYVVPGIRSILTAWAFGLVFLVNAALIVWLWLHGGGVSSVHNVGELFTSIGRITGLLGAYLLLIQVVLLVRLPPLEQLVGFDRLTVWHRLNGKICLYLILAHVVFITIGYAMMDRISIPAEASTLLTRYPGMVTATIGTALLILVVITSVVIVRRRMRYETWFLVHLMAYAGIVLAWFHQIPTGNELALAPTAAAYWTGLYLTTLALLVLFRFAQPILRSLWFRMRVAEVIVEAPGVVSLSIAGRHLDRLGARAGQFFLWRFLTRNRWWESHPFSLSAAPDARSLRITVKGVGDFTSRIGEIQPGTVVVAEGPFGVFTDVARRRDRVALIAGGIGIAPIRALLEEMSGDLVLIYRVVSDDELVFRDELEDLARTRGITLHYVVGDHKAPENKHLMSADHLHQLVPNIASREIYVCGPPAMMSAVEESLRRAGPPSRYIHSEKFAL
jgi:predicted ferric reductase